MSGIAPVESTDQTKQQPRRRRGRVWALAASAVLLLIVAVAFWTGYHPNVPSGPIRLTRGDGGWQRQSDDDESPLRWEAQTGKIEAQNNLSSTASETRSGRAKFACGQLVIFNRSDHLLMQRMGPCLLEELKTLKGFETIDYFPHDERPEPGAVAPDIYVTLDLGRIDESGLAARKLEAEIRMTASNTLMHYSSHYHDGIDPPKVTLEFDATLDHRSTTTGVGSPSSRYKLAAADIGKKLGETLAKKLNDLYDKDGPLPDLPETFYPAYREPPALPLPEGESVDLVTSYHGLMTASDTLWRLETDRTLAEVLTELKERLESDGWRIERLETRDTHLPHLRALKGAKILMAFPERKRDLPSPGVAIVMGSSTLPDAEKEVEPPPTVVFVHYLDRMGREEIAAQLDALLDSDAPMAALIVFESLYGDDQRERLLGRFEERPPASPDQWVVLAQLHKNDKQDDKARDALMRAVLFLRTIGDNSKLKGQIDDLAKKLGDEDLPKLEPEPALLEELGFIELAPGAEIPERELGLDEPVLFYGRSGSDEVRTVAIRLVQGTTDKGLAEHALSYIEAEGGSRSWGTGGLQHYTRIGDRCTAVFEAEKIADAPRFRLTTRVEAKSRGR